MSDACSCARSADGHNSISSPITRTDVLIIAWVLGLSRNTFAATYIFTISCVTSLHCLSTPCTTTLTLSGTIDSAHGGVVVHGDTARVVITAQVSTNPFVSAITTVELQVTTPAAVTVLDTVLSGPFSSPSAVRIIAS